ncbi:cysteine desulfurase family protein [Novosphingobium terrae]|uniref:cysteine desulfurase family protein n=1 Tax=Novosphingobium terrae TaxID=2726189 RepID=UPI001981BEF9|nr:aminotransferase class V-fold PLP-dependent enzyme [Novosphingobium terrae]
MATHLYLDHAATTPLLPVARAAMDEGFAHWANPSSPHRAGRAARAALEDARERVRAALGWQGEVIFTSGASEALAIAMQRCVQPLVAISPVEHEAALRHAGDATKLAVDAFGLVAPGDCALPGLVCVQQVNNETGVIQPLDEIAQTVHGVGGLLLADCAQGAGKIALPAADLAVLSAHKFGGPVGIGALLLRDWGQIQPSGGQERGYRPGTENLPGALAMAAALEAGADWMEEAARLRTRLEAAIIAAGGEVVAQDAPRIATIGAYRMKGKAAAAQLIRFDGLGMAISAGSACSSGSLRASHVLTAMQYPHTSEVIRVSIGRETTEAEIDQFAQAWAQVAG